MTALEMQFAAQKFVQSAVSASNVLATREPRVGPRYKSALGAFARGVETYAWASETYTTVAMAAKTIGSDVVLGQQSARSLAPSWWWFDGGTEYVAEQEGEDLSSVYAILLIPKEITDDSGNAWPWLQTVTFGVRNGLPFPSTSWNWRFGESLASMVARHPAIHPVGGGSDQTEIHARYLGRFVVAAWAWMNQRILSVCAGHVERHCRKRIEREHGVSLSSTVKVIQLRRTESQPRSEPGDGASDWSCRWIVGGHWRNQPYKDNRKLIYIMPYVKGPEDMPLRVPTHTVYEVAR